MTENVPKAEKNNNNKNVAVIPYMKKSALAENTCTRIVKNI